MHQLKPIAILGAGSWGTALALYLARRGQQVRIWSGVQAEITALTTDRMNKQFLPGFAFPREIEPISDLAETIHEIDDVMLVIPSIGFKQVLQQLKPLAHPRLRLICATKGLAATGQLLSEVAVEVFGQQQKFAILSGPSFAKEVAEGLPTSVIIASQEQSYAEELCQRFNSEIFHAQPSNDVIGVEIGGVVKNVIAIATGISDGLGFGANARSALITQGLAEIIQLCTSLGGQLDTCLGLAGLGDLLLTATDNQSRNRRFGLSLGQGQDLKKAEQEIGQTVEGKRNAEIVVQLAKRHNISMPICETVWEILQGKLAVKAAASRFFKA